MLVAEKVPIASVCPTRVIAIDEVPAAFQLMGGAQHMGKMVVRTTSPTFDNHEEEFAADASYLVVGGVRYLFIHFCSVWYDG